MFLLIISKNNLNKVMPKIDSLYELIKKTSQEKGRKIKVIAD
jgi:hypothetical protein